MPKQAPLPQLIWPRSIQEVAKNSRSYERRMDKIAQQLQRDK